MRWAAKPSRGIEAALLVEGFELGELVAVGGDEGLLVGRDVLLERNGLVLGRDLEAAEGGLNLLDGDVQAAGDERQVGVEVFDLLAEEVAGDGGIVVDEEAAFAVEEAAARGEHGHLADAVGLRQHAVVRRRRAPADATGRRRAPASPAQRCTARCEA